MDKSVDTVIAMSRPKGGGGGDETTKTFVSIANVGGKICVGNSIEGILGRKMM
jgi:hypothetical protein